MKTYNQFITELNKFELLLKGGKLAFKSLKKLGLKSTTKKIPVKDILKLRKKNKPVPFGEKDKFSKMAANRKSIHPPTADAAQKKVEDTFMDLTLKKVKRRSDKVDKLKRMFGNPDMGNPGTGFKDTR